MQILRAQPQDAVALTEIAHAAKRHWDYPEQWIAAWKDTLTIRADLIASNVAFLAVEEARPIGFYLLTKMNGELHLDHLWIMPSSMGRGVGRALFEHAVEEARKLDHRILFIESDPNAEDFYKRMGARRFGVNQSIIENQVRELPVLRYNIEQGDT